MSQALWEAVYDAAEIADAEIARRRQDGNDRAPAQRGKNPQGPRKLTDTELLIAIYQEENLFTTQWGDFLEQIEEQMATVNASPWWLIQRYAGPTWRPVWSQNIATREADKLIDAALPMDGDSAKVSWDGAKFTLEMHESATAGVIYAVVTPMRFSPDNLKYYTRLLGEAVWRFQDLTEKGEDSYWRLAMGDCLKELWDMFADREPNLKRPRVAFRQTFAMLSLPANKVQFELVTDPSSVWPDIEQANQEYLEIIERKDAKRGKH